MTRFKTEGMFADQPNTAKDPITLAHIHYSQTMDDITSHHQNVAQHPSLQYREQFTAAMVLAGRKVPKTDIKEETPTEMYLRINAAKVAKENKTIKSAAKKLVKKKKLKKISSFFIKK
jgi:hypothetical protein